MQQRGKMARSALMAAAVVALLCPDAAGVQLTIGPSKTNTASIPVPASLGSVAKCSATPQNECCGELFELKVVSATTVTVTRTDEAQLGWTQKLVWECATDKFPNLHQPVRWRIYNLGANCHVHPKIDTVLARTPRVDINTDQINIQNRREYKAIVHGSLTGGNWVAIVESNLVIRTAGVYRLIVQIGIVDTAVLALNGIEIISTACRDPSGQATVYLTKGLHDIRILYSDDGWSDQLVMFYQGADTNNAIAIVPGPAFAPVCQKSDHFVDLANDNACTPRKTCPTGQYNSNVPLSPEKDRVCTACTTAKCDSSGNPTPTTTSGMTTTHAVPTTVQAQPTCDGCGWRITPCGPVASGRWDVDLIQFYSKNRLLGHDTPFGQVFESGHVFFKDDFQFSAYQAFKVNSHYWRGTPDKAGDYYIGVIYQTAQNVDFVRFMQGWCNEREITSSTTNIASCVSLEKWNGKAWVKANSNAGLGSCKYYQLNQTGVAACPCPASMVGDGKCDGLCNNALCQNDGGDCRTCPAAPIPTNGQAATSAKLLLAGTTVKWSCNTGFALSGAATATCAASGSSLVWNKPAPTCVASSCALPPVGPELTIKSTATAPYTEKDQLVFGCSLHYQLQGARAATCQADGSWDTTFPTCIRSACPAITPPANGAVMGSQLSGDAGLTFSCNRGYRLVGNAMLTCKGTTWSGGAPTCQLVRCPALPRPVNGGLSSTGSQPFGAAVTVTCASGYRLPNGASSTALRCNGVAAGGTVGSWSGAVPACVILDCGNPPVPQGPIARQLTTTFSTTTFNSVVFYTCATGFALSGPRSMTCAASGSWEDAAGSAAGPNCVLQTCPALAAPANGALQLSDGFLWRSVAVVNCQVGFGPGPNTPSAFECIATAQGAVWNVSVGTLACVRIDCGLPPAVANAALSVSTGATFLAATRTYVCNSGYQGGGTQTCAASSQWEPAVSCSQITCPALSLGPNAVLTGATPGVPVPSGTTVTVSCKPGFTLPGGPTLAVTCSGTAWSQALAGCAPIDCGAPPSMPDAATPTTNVGSRSLQTTFGAKVQYSCRTGYFGGGEATCSASGWAGADPCTITDCGTPPGLTSAQAPTFGATTFDAEASYVCSPSFTGGGVRVCSANGQWESKTGTPLFCDARCRVGVTFEIRAQTTTTRRQCRNVRLPCDPLTEFEFAAPTERSDRDCRPVSRGAVHLPADFNTLIGGSSQKKQQLEDAFASAAYSADIAWVEASPGSIQLAYGAKSDAAVTRIQSAAADGTLIIEFENSRLQAFSSRTAAAQAEEAARSGDSDSSGDTTIVVVILVAAIACIAVIIVVVVVMKKRRGSETVEIRPNNAFFNPAYSAAAFPTPKASPDYEEADYPADNGGYLDVSAAVE